MILGRSIVYVYYNKKARQCTIGQVIVPWGSRSPRLRDPQGLEGTIICPIVHWRAFFILFHHFICLKLFVLLKVSRTISLTYAAMRRPCDGRPSHRINAPVNHPRPRPACAVGGRSWEYGHVHRGRDTGL